jgi:hypothetical protein
MVARRARIVALTRVEVPTLTAHGSVFIDRGGGSPPLSRVSWNWTDRPTSYCCLLVLVYYSTRDDVDGSGSSSDRAVPSQDTRRRQSLLVYLVSLFFF